MSKRARPVRLCFQGLQQHVEASHDLFDFSYPKAELEGFVTEEAPTVAVCCPDDMFDKQGRLQTLETNDLADVDGKV